MDPIDHVLLAVMAGIAGDMPRADQHLDAARHGSRSAARRHRQVVEIAGLVVAGACERAEGLALIHTEEFPDDRELLARITRPYGFRGVQP
jgi:hypothetical protein